MAKRKGLFIPGLLLLFCVLSTQTWAQEPLAELNRLRERYTSLKSYSTQLVFKAYKGHTSTELVDMQTGRYDISGTRFRLAMGKTVTLRNERYCLNIDEAFREIDVMDARKQSSAPEYGNFRRIDSILTQNHALSLQTLPDGNRTLTVSLKNSGDEYEKFVIRYRPTGELLALIFFYRGKANLYGIEGEYQPRVEIEYKAQNFNAAYPEGYFSETRYVTIQGTDVLPQPAYKNYQIFDLL